MALRKKKEEEIQLEGSSVIEGGIEIYGDKIVGSTNLMVRGIVNSRIELDADLVLDQEGHINGDIQARNCTIKGKVTGDIRVSGHLQIADYGVVNGNINCSTLEINSGGILIGACNQQIQPNVVRNRELVDSYHDEEEDFDQGELSASEVRMIGKRAAK